MTTALTEFVRVAPGHYRATSPANGVANGTMWEVVREAVGFGTRPAATVWRTYRNGTAWGAGRAHLAAAQKDVRDAVALAADPAEFVAATAAKVGRPAVGPLRSVRVPDDLWDAATRYATDNGLTVSDLIRSALTERIAGGAR